MAVVIATGCGRIGFDPGAPTPGLTIEPRYAAAPGFTDWVALDTGGRCTFVDGTETFAVTRVKMLAHPDDGRMRVSAAPRTRA